MYEKAIAELNPRLFIHSHVVDLLGGNRATGRCNAELNSGKLAVGLVGLGCYEDEYAKVGDKRKFASRHYFLSLIDAAISLRTFLAGCGKGFLRTWTDVAVPDPA